MSNLDADEVFKHARIGHAVCMVEHYLDVLGMHARDIDAGLVARVGDAFAKFADARRELLPPLSRPLPGSNARN
jgi:hypothetical protein